MMTFKNALFKIATLFSCIVIACSCTQHKNVQEQQTASSNTISAFQPESNLNIQRLGYVLAYDGRIRGASWVHEELTPDSIANNNVDRSHFDFMEDPKIPSHLRSNKADFKGSGFDRGHLRPAANAKSSAEAMKETFYLSNITPQDPQLNRKYWLKLEKYTRDLTKSSDVVYVTTGPLFLPEEGEDGKRYVKYKVIGANDVAVPTHYFKVLQTKKRAAIKTEAFIIPNEPIQEDYPLEKFAVTLEKVEKAAGIVFKNK
jgi:endonuclease G, mitochondrial